MMSDNRISLPEKIFNVNYVGDTNYTMSYTRWCLSLLGLWPMVSTNATKVEYCLSKLAMTICCSLMAFVTVPGFINLFFRDIDPMNRLVLMGPLTFYTAVVLKYISIIYRCRVIRECMKHVEADWKNIDNETDWKIMTCNVQTGRDLTILCAGFMYGCNVCHHLIVPLSVGKRLNEFNETVRTVVYPSFGIFGDDQASPTYECIFYTSLLGALVNATVAVVSCNLVAIFVTHACGQFEIVVSRLETLFDSYNDSKVNTLRQRINFIVRTHVRVLGFSSKIDEALREISCVEVSASTLTLCLDVYYGMTVTNIKWNNNEAVATFTYVGAFISFTFNIYLFCHIGELLKEQCDKIERAAYMSEWYNLPGRSGLAIVLIISTGLHPCKIKAGGIVELSLLTFGSIMKTTLAYFNMLTTMGL